MRLLTLVIIVVPHLAGLVMSTEKGGKGVVLTWLGVAMWKVVGMRLVGGGGGGGGKGTTNDGLRLNHAS